MLLALVLGNRCNAACGHCSTSCGPDRTDALAEPVIVHLMDQAAELSAGEPLKFALTGGEPFLDYPLLLRVLAHGRKLGAEVTCVSNAYWATSPDKARSILTAARDAGLDRLGVSTSSFHQKFVKVQRVERALAAARDIGLPCTLKYARVESDIRSDDAIREWGMAAGAEEVQVFAVMPHLRSGFSLPDAEYRRTAGLPDGTCPAAVVTVRESGDAFTCCAPGSDIPFFSLGHITRDPLTEITERFHCGGLQQLLRAHGPIHFARAAVQRGLGSRLRTSYTDVCDLCVHIANDPQLAAVATDAAEAYETQQLDAMLTSLLDDPERAAGIDS